ncbi:putative T6SS immunity periplasmic lipoprotein [Mixta sp. Marseille-Q2659]|uniref:putative T6SS immunity periplasmic lipoprotein n=1 Tax=Mixta sp. Marseille-Q2659 TaxID=2736607 RepID=UPI0023BA08D7|nr:putative T6SS immunity periplasmic lipoprotein [Mixta sp. Marseille-Q2659]
MKIKKYLLSLIVLVSGCHLERPFYQPLSVKLEKNQVCFIVSDGNGADRPLKVGLPYISWRNGDAWKTMSLPDKLAYEEEVLPGECIFFYGIKWLPGEYDVAVKIGSNTTEEIRYATHFTLSENSEKRLSLKK